MRSSLFALCVLSLVLVPTLCLAENLTVLLQDKQFIYKDRSVEAIDIKKGDKITFTNSDSVNYEIFSKSEANPFKLGIMKPEASKQVQFKKAGDVEVNCALHAEMYLEITVK